ncbi:MAG: ribonuclease PH [Acidimicrobiia bacterium]|nr:ribonuclease PH [Acidimicrobiia bacterium]MCY4458613.1 ribonuclease PH [Acidimicrobiaceae bacterium]
MTILRHDGRAFDEMRPLSFVRDYTKMAMGSVLVAFGETRVLCTASVEGDTPRWLRNSGKGWVTAEYAMLPGSSSERVRRRVSGRNQEIQRLIGRSLRAVIDLVVLGERSITVDCDVLSADGGTRTASICGGFVALHDACTRLLLSGKLPANPLLSECAAVSVGMVAGRPLLDLPYAEDSVAEVDFNVVMTGDDELIEVQGTAEGKAFSRQELSQMLDLAAKGIAEINQVQRSILSVPPELRNLDS